MDEALHTADVLSLHLPLNRETAGFLSEQRIRAMKRGAMLVNTARGELVDEPALLAALEDGHLAGAAVDVFAGGGRWVGAVRQAHALVDYARWHGNLILTPVPMSSTAIIFRRGARRPSFSRIESRE